MPVCSIKGCEEALDKYPHTEIVLCKKHLAAAINLIEVLKTSASLLMELQESGRVPPTTAKGKKTLRSDEEIREVVLRILGKSGRAVVSSIMNNYDVERGDFPTKSARVIAVMKSMSIMAEDPSLTLIPRGIDTILVRKEAQQQAHQGSAATQ
jgi:hypothetical protein